MTIVDPHTHIWINHPDFPWPDGSSTSDDEDRTAEMLLELMAETGVDHTVLVQVIKYLWDNSYVVHAIHKYPDKFAGVGRVNPENPEAADHVSEWMEKGVRGVRLSPSGEAAGDWFADRSLMDPIFSRAQEHGVPMLLLTRPPRLRNLVPLLDAHPDLDVVIDHMADCHVDDEAGIRQLTDLSRYDRVYVKISHTWSISSRGYPWIDTHALVKEVYQAFGGQRIMWGTDWPVCLTNAEYGQTLSVVRDEMSSFISAEDMKWVLGRTALKLWPFKTTGE